MASGRLIDYLGQGPIADRPVSLDLTTGALGLWWATDTEVLSTWNGTAWVDIAGGSSGTVESVVAGDGIDVDDTDPANPIVSATSAAVVESVVAGTNVTVDSTDPANPIVSATGGGNTGVKITPFVLPDMYYTFIPGTYVDSITSTSSILTPNMALVFKIIIPVAVNISVIMQVSTASTTTKRIYALYDIDPSTGLPNNLVQDFGELTFTTTGTKLSTAYDVPAGEYWLYMNSGGNTTGRLIALSTSSRQVSFGMPINSVPFLSLSSGWGVARLEAVQTYVNPAPSSLSGLSWVVSNVESISHFFQLNSLL